MDTKTYNGWTNYATWRVNLEMIDGGAIADYDNQYSTISELADYLKEYCENQMYQYDIKEPCIVIDYAISFLSDVNWYELAEHVAEDYPSIIKETEQSEVDVVSNNEQHD